MKVYILILFSLISQGVSAQKHDYNWVLGTDTDKPGTDTFFSNSLLDFKSLPVLAERKYLAMNMRGCNSTISDSAGNLLFFTNGDAINNFEGKQIKNGDTLTYPCPVMNDYRWVGYVFQQAILALPYPGKNNQYILLHYCPENSFTPPFGSYAINVLYSIVDMSKENGRGEVIEKNKTLLEGKTGEGMLSACKHANGRDWWFLWFPYHSNQYHRYLITPNGFEEKETITLQDSISSKGYGYQLFTPDGTKFIKHYSWLTGTKPETHIFDFDRCTGTLSNKKTITTDKSDEFTFSCAISSNSRFFYAMTGSRIDQIDLQANDIQGSITRVANYDGFKDLFATIFWVAQLAPDGKIYITSLSGSRYFHVIEKPDEKGLACDVRQHSFKLYGVNNGGMPNHPNYRLGPVKGSVCDSLTSSIEITEADYHIKVFPNPATSELKIDITLPNYDLQLPTEIRLISAAGAIVKTYTMPDFAYLATLDISDVDSGFYEVQLRQKGKTMAVEKVVVVR